jgi:hypothetical protein
MEKFCISLLLAVFCSSRAHARAVVHLPARSREERGGWVASSHEEIADDFLKLE